MPQNRQAHLRYYHHARSENGGSPELLRKEEGYESRVYKQKMFELAKTKQASVAI